MCVGESSYVHAQSAEPTAFHLQQLRPNGDPSGLFQSLSGKALGQWRLSFQLTLHYTYEPLVLEYNDELAISVMEHMVGADLAIGVGLLPWLDVMLFAPVTIYQLGTLVKHSSLGTASGRDMSGFHAQDIRLQLKLQLLNEKSHFVNLALAPYIAFPTGDDRTMNGEGGISAGGMLSLSVPLPIPNVDVRLFGNIGFRYQPDTTLFDVTIGSDIPYSFGASFGVSPKYVSLIAEYSGIIGVAGKVESSNSPASLLAGVRIFPTGKPEFAINMGAAVGVIGGFGSAPIRIFAGVTIAPELAKGSSAAPKDTDGDGIPDSEDQCPDQAGAKALQGCPAADSDGDGVPDKEDQCPKVRGEVMNRGCPMQDTDKDGIPDNKDNCPRTPGVAENAGCPAQTGSTTQPPAPGGTPPKVGDRNPNDWDGDKIPNRRDRCPYLTGSRRRRGCPYRKYVTLSLRKRRIYMRKAVRFYRGTRMTRRTRRILRQLAELMRNRPTLAIRVDATTYSRSRRKWVARLSRRRARAIRKFLMKEGVAIDRIQFRGYRARRRRRGTKTIFRFRVIKK
tara:strand:+ start:6100 stop:7782 length:1683 start_codon:yes stop_codon:yes gene_type:complete